MQVMENLSKDRKLLPSLERLSQVIQLKDFKGIYTTKETLKLLLCSYIISLATIPVYFPLQPNSQLQNKGNGYKLSVQRFLGLFVRTGVSYDWSMVVKTTINQS